MKENMNKLVLNKALMKHNGGVLFRTISDTEYEFKSTITENHLNAAGITHGIICALVDAGSGTAAHRTAESTW